VDRKLVVGGPATAIDAWIPELKEYCAQEEVPLDFISTHHYPTDASYGLGLDMEAQMARSERGVLRSRVKKAWAEAGSVPLYYTEWNCSPSPRDPYHDVPYNAAFIVKTIGDSLGLLECYSYWTFSDIFEESGFSSMPFHGGFGLLNINGIPKPSYRAFQLLSRLKGDRLEVGVDGASPTVDCVASCGPEGLTILISNHQIPLAPIRAEQVSVRVSSTKRVHSVYLERIDEDHANARKVWLGMGSPTYPDRGQIEALMKASELHRESVGWQSDEAGISISLLIQPHSVVSISLPS
jgi:xylan 1,4-beta-xylosidase